jgi:hypothetical protein
MNSVKPKYDNRVERLAHDGCEGSMCIWENPKYRPNVCSVRVNSDPVNNRKVNSLLVNFGRSVSIKTCPHPRFIYHFFVVGAILDLFLGHSRQTHRTREKRAGSKVTGIRVSVSVAAFSGQPKGVYKFRPNDNIWIKGACLL